MSKWDLEAEAQKDREVRARAHGLEVAVKVTGYRSGGDMDDETLAVYARKFARFILTGDMTL